LAVTDSGPGVPAELTQRVFEYGNTTKPPRDGVPRGLGLALVHRLVTRLGGRIDAGPGPGGRLTAELPGPACGAAPEQAREDERRKGHQAGSGVIAVAKTYA